MKKVMIFFITIVLCFGMVACSQEKEKENNMPAETTKIKNKIPTEALEAIGKTYDQLKEEYPDYVTADDMYMNFMEAAFPYLGMNDAKYNFVFFGTQWGPSLSDIAKFYGDEMECIGVTGKVGDLFPEMTEELTFEEFFSFLDVSDYEFNDWGSGDKVAAGALLFEYQGFDIIINADASQGTKIIKKSYPILITQGDIMRNDDYIQKTDEKLNGTL